MQQIGNQKILVTGGAEFIGSNLCEHLLQHHNKVVCLDNLTAGRTRNIQHLLNNFNFTLIVGINFKFAYRHKATPGVDYTLNEAALGSVPKCINGLFTSNDIYVIVFLTTLIAARDAEVKHFIYATNSSTYGISESLPKVEDKIGNPMSPYTITNKQELLSRELKTLLLSEIHKK